MTHFLPELPQQDDDSNIKNQIVCEHQKMKLDCPKDKEVAIRSAVYGRTTGGAVCPHRSIRTTTCAAKTSLKIVRQSCRGKSNCAIAASNGVFGDPCGGTFKYLNVTYECVEKSVEKLRRGEWTNWRGT